MPVFSNGTHVNVDHALGSHAYRRLRISAGPLRGTYVDTLVLEAKLGRPLAPGMTVEHVNGDSMDCRPGNLLEVTNPMNVKLMHARRKAARASASA